MDFNNIFGKKNPKKKNQSISINRNLDTKRINSYYKFRFGLKERIKLYSKLRDYLREGYAVYDSLLKFKLRFEKRKDFRAKIVEHWLKRMQEGQTFKGAIKGWVPDSELNLIASGEDGQGLDSGLDEAIKFAASSNRIKTAIKKGLTYPVVLFIVIILFISMFSIQLAPAYLEILPLEKWPEAASFLYGISRFIITQWIPLLISLFAITYIVAKTINVWTGEIRKVFDKAPPWSVYKVYQSSSFLISLASMLRSGTPLHDAILKMKKTSPLWMNQYLDKMLKNIVKGGKNYGEHLNVGLLDDETTDDVIDYADLGKFEQAIYTIGENNLVEAVDKIEEKMAVVKNIMLVLVGIAITLIYFSSVELSATAADATAYK
jgi:type II secretory pathway component PulF